MPRWVGTYWVEVLWALFVLANTIGMLAFQEWATVPFHFVWIGLALMYGWRVWELRITLLVLSGVVLFTGLAMLDDVVLGGQAPDEMTEIPLMAVVFVVMVWYVRRSVVATERYRRVSEHNLALLNQQRQFVQDASHVLRTPLTIALGHAELVRRTAADAAIAGDLDVVIDELHRLKHISDRLLALAATEQPDFLDPVDTRVDELVAEAWSHWQPTHPEIRLGVLARVSAPLDRRHVRDALDELVSNAIRHTGIGTPITLSVVTLDDEVALRVVDRGPGIPAEDQPRVLDRFARSGQGGPGGLGLGLALVKAIAEAHGGTLRLRSAVGQGSAFELRLPVHSVPVAEVAHGPAVTSEPQPVPAAR